MFIKDLVESVAKAAGTTVTVKCFNRYQIGE